MFVWNYLGTRVLDKFPNLSFLKAKFQMKEPYSTFSTYFCTRDHRKFSVHRLYTVNGEGERSFRLTCARTTNGDGIVVVATGASDARLVCARVSRARDDIGCIYSRVYRYREVIGQ